MAALFACFVGQRRRESPALSEISDFSTTGFTHNRTDSTSHVEVVYVELLRRQKKQPLGLILKGGTDRGELIQVAELRAGGVAEQSKALQIGDHICSINGTVTAYLTNQEATSLLNCAENVVNLEIAFSPEGSSKLDDGMELKTAFVPLLCDEMGGTGVVISGGRLDNRPITISHVKPESYPYKKGVLRAGDRILQVNGRDMRNASQTDFTEALKQSEGNVLRLQIEYDVTIHEGLEGTVGPLLVELQKPYGASLGISLRDDTTSNSIYISKVRNAGIADRSGALHVGDRLLSINGKQLDGHTAREACHMLASSDINVEIEILPGHCLSERGVSRVEDRVSDTSSEISRLVVPVEFERIPSRLTIDSYSSLLRPPTAKTHPETMYIDIRSDDIGFGMTLQGGSTEYGLYPITISSIEQNGPAEKLGRLMVGDRVIAINGQKLLDETLQQAYKLIQEGVEDMLNLEVEFDVEDPPQFTNTGEFLLEQTENLHLGITLRGNRDKLWIASIIKGGVASRKGCFRSGDILVAVNGESVANKNPKDVLDLINFSGPSVSLTIRRETINNFVTPSSRRSPHSKTDDVIYSVELERGNQSLGISLQGSERKGQPIIISHVKEGGVAHRTQALRTGDRVLAINGESLSSKTLDDAVRLLQSTGSTVTLKISKNVVSIRKQRPRFGGSGARHYRNQRHRFHNNRGLYPSRGPSRMSMTSDSELSTVDYLSETNLEKPSLNGGRFLTRGRYSNPAYIGRAELPGHYSPTNRPRHSPPNRGRQSPIKNGSVGNRNGILSTNEVVGTRLKKRDSFNETTDEEIGYEENYYRLRQVNGHHGSDVESGTGLSDQEHVLPTSRLPPRGSAVRRKTSSPVGRKSIDSMTAGGRATDKKTEEVILRQLESTLLKSKDFVHKLTELATHSGSSDQDSDSEPIRPHLKHELMRHVKELLRPQHLDMLDVHLVRSPHAAGFGLSLSDGVFENGVYVNQIQPGGPADVAGLCPYDRIIKFNDLTVKDDDCCKVMPLFSQAGDDVLLTIARNPLAGNNGAAAHSTMSPILVEREKEEEMLENGYS